MPFFTVLTLSVGLAMDAMAVSATKGLCKSGLRPWHTLRMALLFGAFQAGMPVLGWAIGGRFAKPIAAWDHWIAFVLLSGIGARMIYEVVRGGPASESGADQAGGWSIFVLAVATSIDALAAGLTLPFLDVSIVFAAAMIGVTTAVLSGLGVYLGRHFGARVGRNLEVIGGLLLITLGTKILIEHTLVSYTTWGSSMISVSV